MCIETGRESERERERGREREKERERESKNQLKPRSSLNNRLTPKPKALNLNTPDAQWPPNPITHVAP